MKKLKSRLFRFLRKDLNISYIKLNRNIKDINRDSKKLKRSYKNYNKYRRETKKLKCYSDNILEDYKNYKS